MIKIMIVDDMPIFLEYLRGCIDWNSYGFEICCEAHDGREALEKIDEYYPDVVLTDITMPYINGLELAERITADYQDISVILITGNNEFEYARKAVKIGVCDYIVKPFEKEELILSLLKLHDNIEKAVEDSRIATEKELNAELSDELKTLIYAGLSDKENLSQWEEKIFPNCHNYGGYLVALVKFDATAFSHTRSDAREKLMNWENLIAKLLADKLDIEGQFRLFHDFENNIVVLMNFESEAAIDEYKGYEFTDIIQIIKSQLEIGCSIVLSKISEISEVKRAYEKSLSFLAEKGFGQLWDLRKEGDVEILASLDVIMMLNKDLETLQADDAEKAINTLWARLNERKKDETGITISDMNLLTSAVSILMTNIISCGFSIDTIYGEGFSPEKFLEGATTSKELRDNVIFLYRKRIEFEKGKKESRTHNIATGAKEYIEQNFGDSALSISDISEALCVNQTYLRKMFKSEMNMTLTEYITSYRMQEAKKLITTTDNKLSDVAEKVGYNDVSYFSNVFKKYYGISPRTMSKE